MSEWRTAIHCRNRAVILRTIAAELDRADHKISLTRIAQHFEVLADKLEHEVLDETRYCEAWTGI